MRRPLGAPTWKRARIYACVYACFFVRTNVAFKWTLSGERINYSLALFFLLLLEEMKRRFEKMKIGEDIYIFTFVINSTYLEICESLLQTFRENKEMTILVKRGRRFYGESIRPRSSTPFFIQSLGTMTDSFLRVIYNNFGDNFHTKLWRIIDRSIENYTLFSICPYAPFRRKYLAAFPDKLFPAILVSCVCVTNVYPIRN